MARMSRWIKCGAVFADDLSSVRSLEKDWGATLTNSTVASYNGRMAITFTNGSLTIPTQTYTSYSYWHDGTHYAYDGTNVYTDGVQTGTEPITISATGFSSETGTIYDLMYFDRVLTQAEVTDIYLERTFNYDDYLVSGWHMDSINPRDFVGTNNGTGTSIVASNIVEGINSRSKAIDFDGSNDYITISSIPSGIDLTGNYSVICSTYYESASSNGNVISFNYSSGSDNRLGLGIDTSFKNKILSNGVTTSAGSVIGLNAWAIQGYSSSSYSMDAYLNGVFDYNITPSTTSWISGLDSITIGSAIATGAPSNYMDGKSGVVLLYSTNLTEMQHRDITNRINEGRL